MESWAGTWQGRKCRWLFQEAGLEKGQQGVVAGREDHGAGTVAWPFGRNLSMFIAWGKAAVAMKEAEWSQEGNNWKSQIPEVAWGDWARAEVEELLLNLRPAHPLWLGEGAWMKMEMYWLHPWVHFALPRGARHLQCFYRYLEDPIGGGWEWRSPGQGLYSLEQ